MNIGKQSLTYKQNPTHQYQQVELADVTKTVEDTLEVSQIIPQNKQPKTPSHTYRADIDGLRTIAILTVVIYHAFPQFMPGGFIGVDVFFVISGYLISQIIIKETRQNRFSYANFYSRRIKRIYPALLLILIYVLYMVTKYYRYDQLGFTLKTLSASSVFGANFQVLAHEKGYFDPEIHVNPLLHLWSLGVEEQFYIFWPCLIAIGLNIFKKRTFLVLALYTALSFIIGIVSVYKNPKFAFYFPVCRFWQMAIGGLVAYFSLKIQNTKITNALSFVGTLAILVTVWIIDEESLFPGFWALIPTFASAFIIQAGPQPFINKYILSSKPFVFIGKISYPMYLWHWPLLVFSRYFYPQGSTSIFSNLYFVILMTVLLSIVTYYFVENPIREIKTKKIAIVLFIIILILGCMSYYSLIKARERQEIERLKNDINYILANAEREMIPRPEDYIEKNGRKHPNLSKSRNRQRPTVESTQIAIKDYLNDRKLNYEMILDKQVTEQSKYYVKNPPVHAFQIENEGRQNQVFFIGDSHALRIGYHFQQLYRNSLAQGRESQFPTVLGMSKMGIPLIGENSTLFNFTMDLMKKHKPKRLLLAFHWLIAYCGNIHIDEPKCRYEQFDIDMKILQQFIKQAQSIGVEVSSTTIALDHPNFHNGNMIDANGIIEQNLKPVNLTWYKEKHKIMIDKLETALNNAGAEIIDLTDNLCYEGMCQVTSPSGHSVYYDTHHHGKFYSRHWLSVVDHLVQF